MQQARPQDVKVQVVQAPTAVHVHMAAPAPTIMAAQPQPKPAPAPAAAPRPAPAPTTVSATQGQIKEFNDGRMQPAIPKLSENRGATAQFQANNTMDTSKKFVNENPEAAARWIVEHTRGSLATLNVDLPEQFQASIYGGLKMSRKSYSEFVKSRDGLSAFHLQVDISSKEKMGNTGGPLPTMATFFLHVEPPREKSGCEKFCATACPCCTLFYKKDPEPIELLYESDVRIRVTKVQGDARNMAQQLGLEGAPGPKPAPAAASK